jgi:hypothetical protein
MEGWLEKSSGGHKQSGGVRGQLGNARRTYNRRFFVLTNQTLT